MATSIARPRFLERIEAHDFKAVAAKGCFVYCYLRTTGTPYYVGIAKNPRRPLHRHTTTVPKERARIRVLRTGLTWEQACEWEQRYIARWGRRDNGTGILHNRTDGGDGALGVIPSPETRAKMSAVRAGRPLTAHHASQISAALKGRPVTEEWRAKLSAANKGKTLTAEHRAKISAGGKGVAKSKPMTPEHHAKLSAANKGKTLTAETRAKISAANKGMAKPKTPEHRAKLSAANKGKPAPNKGKPHTEEIRAKISAATKASMTAERRAKISATNTGKTASIETRAKMSAAHKARHKKARCGDNGQGVNQAL